MVKQTQTIRRKLPTNCLSVFDHFVKLVLNGLRISKFDWLNFFDHAQLKIYKLPLMFVESIPVCQKSS